MKEKKTNKHQYTCRFCGSPVYSNVINNHLRFACTATKEEADYWIKILKSENSKRWCWIKAEGTDAQRINNWRPLVFTGELSVDDITFCSPRPTGVMTSTSRAKLSKERMGANNPSIKGQPHYEHSQISKVVKKELDNWQKDEDLFKTQKDFLSRIEETIPKWRYSCANLSFENISRKENPFVHVHNLIAHFSGTPVEEYDKWIKYIKSKRIVAGVVGSFGSYVISKPEQKLFEMISQFDPNCQQQYKQKQEKGYIFSYDMFSPALNAVIEMHGRVWHDPTNNKGKMKEIATKHKIKDEIKAKLAIDLGLNYIVFWDDQQDTWENKINELFKNQIS